MNALGADAAMEHFRDVVAAKGFAEIRRHPGVTPEVEKDVEEDIARWMGISIQQAGTRTYLRCTLEQLPHSDERIRSWLSSAARDGNTLMPEEWGINMDV